jgi:aspartyl-tRNA(Asn)/glutamyl-tRNA(Gln) amidotransferase subunit C
MKIDEKTVDAIAHLARLEFEKEEKAEIIDKMNKILTFVDKLNEVDTDNIEPLIYMNETTNVLREDEVKQDITQVQALENAPDKDSDYFKVPKVIDKGN